MSLLTATTSEVLPVGARVVATGAGTRSVRCQRRTVLTVAALFAAAIVAGSVAMTVGEFDIAFADVVATLLGDRGDFADTVVLDWRLPRVLATILFGAALGASGALFQSLAANPLASPDVVGFDTGAATGALVVLLVLHGSSDQLLVASVLGGTVTALLVYALAYRRGVNGFRLILVGISVSAMLAAVNQYLLIKANEYSMIAAQSWLIGSLNGIGWERFAKAAAVLAVLLPAAVAIGRPLRWGELGDDAALALGVRLQRVRLAAVLVGVALTAVVTSVCGPITFVALAAPQIGVRAARTPGLALGPAMATGAALLALSDLVALRLLAPTELPVGAVTVSVGGCYFVWLMYRERGR